MEEWINKILQSGAIYTMEYYLAKKGRKYSYNMDAPWKLYAKWKRPGTKGHMYDPISLNPPE